MVAALAGLGELDELLAAASLLVGPAEVVVATDRRRRVTWVSPSVEEAFGWSRDEFAEVCPRLIHPDDALLKEAMVNRVRAEPGVRHVGVARHRARDGSWLWLEVLAVNLLSSHGIVLTRFRDVTGTKQAERALADLARDDLTGLVTRRIVRQTLEHRLAEGPEVAVLFCDLDGFKAVNDDLGHAEGDRLLEALGQRLRRWQTEAGSLVGRWGGDEFVALAEPGDAGLEALVEEVRTAVRGDDGLAASVGAVLAAPGDDPLAAIRRADEAMYAVKHRRP